MSVYSKKIGTRNEKRNMVVDLEVLFKITRTIITYK